jgi:hypothetical protein
VHLDDVYWSERGRISFDAVVCTCAFAALVVIGTRPFGLDDPGSIWGTALVVLVVIGLTTACFAKGRVLFGVIGLFVPFVALAGAVRLARPASPWARARYADDSAGGRRSASLRRARSSEPAAGSPISLPGARRAGPGRRDAELSGC